MNSMNACGHNINIKMSGDMQKGDVESRNKWL